MAISLSWQHAGSHLNQIYQLCSQFYQLCKPRVVSLIVFTAVVGMFLASPGMAPLQALLAGALGIALVAGAAAAVNCLVERKTDALMMRTRGRARPAQCRRCWVGRP